jgi:hypothetical protein
MTVKIDGSNGLLQNYDFQTLTTGFSYTFTSFNVLFANPAGTLATGTVTMPASPVDGMTVTITSTQQITALTINANTGQSIVAGGVVQLNANTNRVYLYRLANTTWYLLNIAAGNVVTSVNGSAGAVTGVIVSGTAVASTSGTSIDFTSIPSWVKRITVMFNGVSTNGTSSFLIQLGDSGGVETSGYLGMGFYFSTGGTNTSSTAGFFINTAAQSTTVYGQMIISLQDATTNTWVQQGNFSAPGITVSLFSSGAKALSATLDRVRITTVSGTDTFDAGSINILYE